MADKLKPLCTSLAEAYFTGRYPGFDLDEADWPALRVQLEEIAQTLAVVKARVAGK